MLLLSLKPDAVTRTGASSISYSSHWFKYDVTTVRIGMSTFEGTISQHMSDVGYM